MRTEPTEEVAEKKRCCRESGVVSSVEIIAAICAQTLTEESCFIVCRHA